MSIHTKCPICKKGSGFVNCCGFNKETGEKSVKRPNQFQYGFFCGWMLLYLLLKLFEKI